MKKKVLVTGSAGFIAPHIIEACYNMGWQVVGIDILETQNQLIKSNITYVKKNIFDLKDKDLMGFDYVAHTAFITNIPSSIQRPVETTYENIDMTAYFLKQCTLAGVKKFVFPSTASLYGNNPIPWTEDMSADPIEPYSWQKLSCEFLCKMWTKRYSLPTTTLRLYQVFGENQRQDTALSAFIRSKKTGKSITLTETTAQSTFKTGRRDFIYVKDVAKAFVATMTSDKTGNGEILNVGSGKMHTMEEIAKTIGSEIVFIPKRNFEVEAHQADMTKCYNLIDWKPEVEIIPWLKNFIKNI
jgi:UDP-glucose 4-epimerase